VTATALSFHFRASVAGVLLFFTACGGQNVRGIADKRSDFRKFMPMTGEPSRYGLKSVHPYFKRANRAQIMRAIEQACQDGRKRGSSVLNPRADAGYYVNCNPKNRQLLNGYVPANGREAPHSGH
jgi:hypothetical protein